MRLLFVPLLLMIVALRARAAAGQDAPTSHDEDVRALSGHTKVDPAYAAARLQKAGPEAIPSLLKSFDSGDYLTTARALTVIAGIAREFKSFAYAPVAVAVAERGRLSKSSAVREEVEATLYDLGGATAAREVKRFAAEDPAPDVRAVATVDLYFMLPNPAIQAAFFQQQTKDKSLDVRLNAYRVLAELGDDSGRSLALKTISENNPLQERIDAFNLLGAIGNPRDSEFLRRASESSAEIARWHAFDAYWQNKLKQVPPGQRLDVLMKWLDHPDEKVRNCARFDLTHSRDPNVETRLRKYLKEKGHVGYDAAAYALMDRH